MYIVHIHAAAYTVSVDEIREILGRLHPVLGVVGEGIPLEGHLQEPQDKKHSHNMHCTTYMYM